MHDNIFLIFRGFNKNAENDKIDFKLKVPRISMISKYKISGRVLILPIQGEGRSNMTMGMYICPYNGVLCSKYYSLFI